MRVHEILQEHESKKQSKQLHVRRSYLYVCTVMLIICRYSYPWNVSIPHEACCRDETWPCEGVVGDEPHPCPLTDSHTQGVVSGSCLYSMEYVTYCCFRTPSKTTDTSKIT